jgi:hypothetical protein
MNKKTHKKILVSGVIATLSFLPGCTDMFKGGNAQAPTENRTAAPALTGEVLVRIKGVPAITTDSLNREKENLSNANPAIKQAFATLDPQQLLAVDRNLLDGLIAQKMIEEYITSHKIDKTNKYQSELEYLYAERRGMLNEKYFGEQIAVTVSEPEMKSFYEANKDTMLRISHGGVAATGIEFADGAAARAFAARVKSSPGGFKKVAQDDGLTAKIKDFKLVNNQSVGIDGQLRDKIAAIKTVPSVEIFEVNGMFWVINATEKEEPKYVPYEQIKDRIKEQLELQKRREAMIANLENLKKEYDVEINEDYFMPEQSEMETNAQAMMNPAAAPHVQDKEQRLA